MSLTTELWTDGSGTMKRDPGGWAYVLRAMRDGEVVAYKEDHGGESDTTNNRMELQALIEGLHALKRSTVVNVFSDSEYVCKGAGWVYDWQRNGWRTREGEQVANVDLWQDVASARKLHALRFKWVRGHAKRFRCNADECAWDDEKPEEQKGKRIVICPDCGERATSYDVYPLNARCDSLAGDERRAFFEVEAIKAQNPEWMLMVCPTCAGTMWGPVGISMCANGHDVPHGVQMIPAVKKEAA